MRSARLAPIVMAALATGAMAQTQDHDMTDHQRHLAAMAGDNRQPVSFPPPMRQHMLDNMRDHLQALADILTALSGSEYARAAQIARARLGMDSPAAAGCNPGATATGIPQMSQPMDMERMMARFMPEGMRNAGLDMHQSASVFAAEADKAATSGDARPAFAALARVTGKCVACHTAYRME